MAPKRSQYEPEGHLKGPNMSQKGAKMSTKGPKGSPKVSPKSTKILQKNTTSKNVDFRGVQVTSFGIIFDLFLLKLCVQKSKRKTMLKKASKITKFKQKTRYDSIPRNAFSHRLSAKAVPPK